MRKSILVFFFLAASFCASAQSFSGQAIYESKTNLKNNLELKDSRISGDQMQIIEDQIKKAFEKTFVLYFDASSSLYEEQKKLQQQSSSSVKLTVFSSDGGGVLFKNIKTKETVNAIEAMDGKNYLVSEFLPIYDWKISSQSKKIGNYNCTKALATIKVTAIDLVEYQRELKEKSSSNIIIRDEPKDKIITAWFTSEIPVATGPEKYHGLPGLILELNYDKTVLLCSKIILNPKDKKEIKKPSNGKVVTKNEFEKIMKDGLNNLQIDNSNRNGSFQTIKFSR